MPRDANGKAVKDDGMVHMKSPKSKGAESGGSDYPYGLRVHVDHDGLKQLGMDEMPDVGHAVELRAKAQVAGVHEAQHEDGTKTRRLELQITHMGLHHKADGMKAEDQGDSGKAGAGKAGEKAKAEKGVGKDANYSRKRS